MPVILVGLLAFGAAFIVIRELAILAVATFAGLVIGLSAAAIADTFVVPPQAPVGTIWGLITFLGVYGAIQWRRWRQSQ